MSKPLKKAVEITAELGFCDGREELPERVISDAVRPLRDAARLAQRALCNMDCAEGEVEGVPVKYHTRECSALREQLSRWEDIE